NGSTTPGVNPPPDEAQIFAHSLADQFPSKDLQAFVKGLRTFLAGPNPSFKPSLGQLWALFKTKISRDERFKPLLQKFCSHPDFSSLLEKAYQMKAEENAQKLIAEEEKEKEVAATTKPINKKAAGLQNKKLKELLQEGAEKKKDVEVGKECCGVEV